MFGSRNQEPLGGGTPSPAHAFVPAAQSDGDPAGLQEVFARQGCYAPGSRQGLTFTQPPPLGPELLSLLQKPRTASSVRSSKRARTGRSYGFLPFRCPFWSFIVSPDYRATEQLPQDG